MSSFLFIEWRYGKPKISFEFKAKTYLVRKHLRLLVRSKFTTLSQKLLVLLCHTELKFNGKKPFTYDF